MRRACVTGCLIPLLAISVPLTVAADVYDCYTRKGDPGCELPLEESQTCKLGHDFRFRTMELDGQATVCCIHAGRIERDAGTIAAQLAARLNWDFYEFLGYGSIGCLAGMTNSGVLHITSASFNEPTLVSMVANDRRTISIHGYAGSASDDPGVEVICAGGKDDRLIACFAAAVARRSSGYPGFRLVVDHGPEFACPVCRRLNGDDVNNIVNRNRRGAGMQLELSLRLREALVESGPSGDSLRELFYGSVQEGLARADGGDHGGREGLLSRLVARLRERLTR